MNIGGIGSSSTVAPLAAPQVQQGQPGTLRENPAEEATESYQERAKEAGKGENIDTHA